MEISMPVMAALVIAAVLLPYLWFILVGRKDQRKNKKQIKTRLKNENLTLDFEEQWNDNFIGIDQTKKVLFFYKSSEVDSEIHLINLNDIASCRINKTFNNLKKENKVIVELKTLDLELIYPSKRESFILNFYDVDNYFNEDFEQKRAEKWLDLILKNCNKAPLKKAA